MGLVVIGRRGAGQLSFGSDRFAIRQETSGVLVGHCPSGEEPLVHARVECFRGARHGGDCLTCGHLAGWRLDSGGRFTVECRFVDTDPVTLCMTPLGRLVTISSARPASEAAAMMHELGLHHLLVTDGAALTGVLARGDLLLPTGEARVADRMSREVIAVDATATLGEAAAALSGLGIGCLPVVSERVVAGLVTRADLRHLGISV